MLSANYCQIRLSSELRGGSELLLALLWESNWLETNSKAFVKCWDGMYDTKYQKHSFFICWGKSTGSLFLFSSAAGSNMLHSVSLQFYEKGFLNILEKKNNKPLEDGVSL